jgi:hypothetical protein
MDCLNYKPVYEYTRSTSSTVYYNGYSNCCLISSFQINMKKYFPEFPSLDMLLSLLYPNTKNAYTHFALEFPQKWYKLKQHLISEDISWKEKLDKFVIRFFTPVNSKKSECVLISVIDMNKVNHIEISNCNYDSLKDALTDEIPTGKTPIDILQLYNHFEPINIGKKVRDRSESIEVVVNKSFFK